jgi:hypothetical protein
LCATFGAPQLTPRALGNVEQRRRGVDPDELSALAAALDVPPLLLLFPPDTSILVLGRQVNSWDAARWWSGESPRPYSQAGAKWESGAAPAILRRQHERQISEWRRAPRLAEVAAGDNGDVAGTMRRLRAHALWQLRTIRGEMIRRGLKLPDVPTELGLMDAP